MRLLPITYVFMAAVVAVAPQDACMPSSEPRVAGKTAGETFKNPKLAQLARAACEGDVAAVQCEVDQGTNPNTEDMFGYTPLVWATYCESLPGIEALIRAGADPNYKVQGEVGTFTAVFVAARNSHSESLRLFLKHGGDPNARETGAKTTALDVAFRIGLAMKNWDNYYLLLNAGADPNPREGEGSLSVADEAALTGNWKMVDELLYHGYHNNLDQLGLSLQIDYGHLDPDQAKWALKVRAILESKGVHFPVRPDKPNTLPP